MNFPVTGATIAAMAKLKPAFEKDGTVTQPAAPSGIKLTVAA